MSDPDTETDATPTTDPAVFETELRELVQLLVETASYLRCGSRLQRSFLKTAILLGRIDSRARLEKDNGDDDLAVIALGQINTLHGLLPLTDRRAALVGEARNKIEHFLSGYDQTVVLQ